MTDLQSRLQRFVQARAQPTDKRAGLRAVLVLLAALTGAVARISVSVAQTVVPPDVQSAVRPSLLHEVFQDHAVLQRDKPIAVWGQAPAGEVVTLSLQPSLTAPAVSSVRAQADSSGRWHAVLPPMGAGGPFVLAAQGSSGARQSAQDVLIGDVFLCSGQSNMEMSVLRAANSDGEIRSSTNDAIRLLSIDHDISPTPLAAFRKPVAWRSAAPETVPDWSAVCFFFARELQAGTHAPIGLVQSAWGGANIRPWMSAAALQAHGGYESGLSLLKLYAREPAAAQSEFAQQWEQWWRGKTGDRRGAEPWSLRPPQAPGQWRTAPPGLGDWRKWGVPELASFTGSVWYRTLITLTAAQAKAAVTVSLGAINQVDETWINGHALGNTFGYETERTYAIPPGVLHAGDNVLVVNALTTYGAGGLLGDGTRRALSLRGGELIPLGAAWQYRIVPSAIGDPPRTPWQSVGGLSTIYNAMVAPLGPYGLRGVLWYQGESNTGEAQTYRSLLEALMADWRHQFGADVPFLIVQLPNYGPPALTPVESGWAEVREAERRAVANDPHAGLAVTIDIGDPHNLHPPNKQDVAKRLAQAARHVIFGESSPPSGPTAIGATRTAERIAVEFADIERGLVTYSHANPIGFELCADLPGSCRFAEAQIEGSRVLLTVPTGSSPPTRVRYCWGDSPVCTLFDGSGLPVGPFELSVVPPRVQLTSEQDHDRMMALLHIGSLRRGPDGNPTSPNAANFDESKVNPNLRLPDPLVLNNGRRVRSSDSWWRQRRPEIVAAFDKEVYGRVPPDVPRVTWRVMRTNSETHEGVPVIAKEITGRVDNSAYPLIDVNIQLTLTTPANASGPVPVIMELSLAPEALAALRKRFTDAQWAQLAGSGPGWQSQVLAKGWGYAVLIPTSVQADNGEGLTQGVIGPLAASDLPVDSHELIALCAPRPVFISSGSQQVEGGWVDAKGMFLGAVGAGPVYKLLCKKDLGTAVFPPMETALTDGDIAFRQHSGGHTDGPNWPTFLTFASRYIKGS